MNDSNKNFNLKFKNFKAEDVQTEETINAVFVLDISPSMLQDNAIGELNTAYNDFIQTMQQSHVHDRLFVSNIEFYEKLEVINGFMPLVSIQPLALKSKGGGTALYDATLAGLKNAIEYKETLEKTGVTCKTLLFIITDGEDNSSKPGSAEAVKEMIEEILKNEKNTFSFTSILFGVGNEANFEDAQRRMGIQNLAKIGYSGKDIRKMIQFISSSISSSSSGQKVSTANF